MKKSKILALILLAAFGISGCQKSPESSIVVNKDFDKLIDEAKKTGENSISVEDMTQYDTYQTTIQDESFGVTVNVDAKVDIPKTSQLSVLRVSQKAISQEFLDAVKEKLIGGETLYEGSMVNVRTKEKIEQEILETQAMLEDIQNRYQGEDLDTYQKEYQNLIERLQEEYAVAPGEITLENYPSDGLLHSAAQLYEKDPNNEYYSWAYDLNPNGEIFYGVSDADNSKYLSLYVQNNENYGNCLRFRNSRHGYEFVSYAYVGGSNLTGDYPKIWKAGEEMPDLSSYMDVDANLFKEYSDEAATISQEQAREIADAFLEEMGLTDFQYSEGGLYCEIPDIREGTEIGYRKIYILRYMRNIDNASVLYGASGKHSEGWSEESYVKKDWSDESIEFRINDDGIIGFDYNGPLEVLETVVENANLKTFDEIKGTFETMVIMTNADEEIKTTIDVDRVRLGYARISEADRFDTGLLVPVWVFKGRKSYSYKESSYDVILTINAIDGSVIDSELGY